jgi:hypothetical protein
MPGPVQMPSIRKPSNGTLPNLIIIGAQKCGTSSLHYYLNLHPQISMSREKELDFFIQEFNWHRGVEWYKSRFTGTASIHGEASPNYTNYPYFRGVPAKTHATVPEAKLIYIVRDPIERIISHYIHRSASGSEHRELSEALAETESTSYLWRSKYYTQLAQYLDYFPQSSILILTQEDLQNNRRETLQEVFRFLCVDDTFYSPRFSRIRHSSVQKRRKTPLGLFLAQTPVVRAVERLPFKVPGKARVFRYFPFSRRIARPTLNDNLREALVEQLAEDINRLRAYTGRSLEQWSV